MLDQAFGLSGNAEPSAMDAARAVGEADGAHPRQRLSEPVLAATSDGNVAVQGATAHGDDTPRDQAPSPPQACASSQMTLHQAFAGSPADRRKHSNTVALWDSLPRYSVDRRVERRLRTAEGLLPPIEMDAGVIDGVPMSITIYPGLVAMEDGSSKAFFPGEREELVERALRKLAAQQINGFDDGGRGASGVRFSIAELRREVSEHFHQIEHAEIVEALEIMAGSGIEVYVSGPGGHTIFARNNYLNGLVGVTDDDNSADTEAKWNVTFHPLLISAIESIDCRQITAANNTRQTP